MVRGPGAGASVKQKLFIATLVASAMLAFAGMAKASTPDSSPPAPLRVAASPRRSVAGASATATHAARSRHGRRHHRRHHAEKAQLSARLPESPAGASPPQPVRRQAAPRHAALRPPSHGRSHARNRTSGFGSAAMLAGIVASPEAGRLDTGRFDEPAAGVLSLNRGRGPPRAPPRNALSPSLHLGIIASSTPHPNKTQVHRPSLARSLSAPADARPGSSMVATQTRDRLSSQSPHADRMEGAVACIGMPS
jgi:hypothetical protein